MTKGHRLLLTLLIEMLLYNFFVLLLAPSSDRSFLRPELYSTLLPQWLFHMCACTGMYSYVPVHLIVDLGNASAQNANIPVCKINTPLDFRTSITLPGSDLYNLVFVLG